MGSGSTLSRPITVRSWLLMMRIGSLRGAHPWPDTCTSGLPLELPLSAKSTESVLTMAPPLPTGPAVTAVSLERLCKLWRDSSLPRRDPNGGRRLTSQGRRDLDRIAAQLKAKKAEALAAQAAAVIATAWDSCSAVNSCL